MSRARGRISVIAMLTALSMAECRSHVDSRLSVSAREKVRRSLTMRRTRLAPSQASLSATTASDSDEMSKRSSRRASSSATWFRFVRTKVSGLLISCAMPAAMVPTDAIRSAISSWSCICCTSVTSRTMIETYWPSKAE